MTHLWTRPVTAEEEADIATFMTRLAAARPGDSPTLPDADLMWLKAQLLRRWDVERRVQAPLDAMEPVQIAAGLGAAALLLMWSLPPLLSTLSSIAMQVPGI